MSEVRVRENESLESALKRFKRSCAKSGVLAEVRKREHYESPSVKRRKKSEAARKNRKKFRYKNKTPQQPRFHDKASRLALFRFQAGKGSLARCRCWRPVLTIQ